MSDADREHHARYCYLCEDMQIQLSVSEDAAQRLEALTAERDALREALAPLLDEFGARLSDGKPVGYTIGSMNRSIEMIRNACEALATAPAAGDKEAACPSCGEGPSRRTASRGSRGRGRGG